MEQSMATQTNRKFVMRSQDDLDGIRLDTAHIRELVHEQLNDPESVASSEKKYLKALLGCTGRLEDKINIPCNEFLIHIRKEDQQYAANLLQSYIDMSYEGCIAVIEHIKYHDTIVKLMQFIQYAFLDYDDGGPFDLALYASNEYEKLWDKIGKYVHPEWTEDNWINAEIYDGKLAFDWFINEYSD